MSRNHVHAGTAVNFTGSDEVTLTLTFGTTSSESSLSLAVPPTVCMQSGQGACRFQFDMTAEGARALSKLLFDAAHTLDSRTEDAQ